MVLSIITINFNNAGGLQKTLDSVISQNFTDFEYIIIDGGSTDNSLDIIKDNEDKISYWVSEKDNGVYHAMNKGIAKANGEYLLMLNSGDALSKNFTLLDIFENCHPKGDILYGQILWQKNGQFHLESNFPPILNLEYFWENSIGHQATFIKRSCHDIVGLYDEKLKISSDWKFFLLAFQKYQLSFKYLPVVVAICDNGGISWDQTNYFLINRERASTIKKYLKGYYKEYKQFRQSNKIKIKSLVIILTKKVVRMLKLDFLL